VVELSLNVEPEFGWGWNAWQRMASEIESLGFACLYRSDHFTANAEWTDQDSLELIVSLTWLASHTSRIRFGSLVAPLSFRDPVMLARQAAAIDDLSGGRLILGIGAGDFELEHRRLGYAYEDGPTRLARFNEGLEVITRLLHANGPIDHEGRFYRLQEALLPRPRRDLGPRILVGGNSPKRILPLAAGYADIWNAFWISPDEFRRRSVLLDEHLSERGRARDEVARSITLIAACGRTDAELERSAAPLRRWLPQFQASPLEELLGPLRSDRHALVGTPDDLVAGIRAYAEAGADEVVLHWMDPDDVESLALIRGARAPACPGLSPACHRACHGPRKPRQTTSLRGSQFHRRGPLPVVARSEGR
jgi:alkanesulfonate monooxygenase SsuD/methylene tetrahydromethanopterin reductase-like flavin-dependent oxidoreductase (luciferase family)